MNEQTYVLFLPNSIYHTGDATIAAKVNTTTQQMTVTPLGGSNWNLGTTFTGPVEFLNRLQNVSGQMNLEAVIEGFADSKVLAKSLPGALGASEFKSYLERQGITGHTISGAGTATSRS